DDPATPPAACIRYRIGWRLGALARILLLLPLRLVFGQEQIVALIPRATSPGFGISGSMADIVGNETPPQQLPQTNGPPLETSRHGWTVRHGRGFDRYNSPASHPGTIIPKCRSSHVPIREGASDGPGTETARAGELVPRIRRASRRAGDLARTVAHGR